MVSRFVCDWEAGWLTVQNIITSPATSSIIGLKINHVRNNASKYILWHINIEETLVTSE